MPSAGLLWGRSQEVVIFKQQPFQGSRETPQISQLTLVCRFGGFPGMAQNRSWAGTWRGQKAQNLAHHALALAGLKQILRVS